jgi:hypothetical protein
MLNNGIVFSKKGGKMTDIKSKLAKTLDSEPMKNAGFTDYLQAFKQLGIRSDLIKSMDSPESPSGANSHRVIAEQLANLGLPVQQYANPNVRDFLLDPETYFQRLAPNGDYFFCSILPGDHLYHGDSPEEVAEFISQFAKNHPDKLDTEIYLTHNGEAAMSGHIKIANDDAPNTIFAEFTTGNFNLFHRGGSSPDITLSKIYHRFEWQWLGDLTLDDSRNWRSDQLFECYGGVQMSRGQMAQQIIAATASIPCDGDYYLPGYYEVLFEKTSDHSVTPVFVEANLQAKF